MNSKHEKHLIKCAIKMLARRELVKILEDQLCIACYSDEPISDLRECLYEHMTGEDPFPVVYLDLKRPHNTHSLAHMREEPATYQSASGLKQRRLALKHTQKDAALCCGVSTRTWRRYESGDTPIPKSIWNWYTVVVTE